MVSMKLLWDVKHLLYKFGIPWNVLFGKKKKKLKFYVDKSSAHKKLLYYFLLSICSLLTSIFFMRSWASANIFSFWLVIIT